MIFSINNINGIKLHKYINSNFGLIPFEISNNMININITEEQKNKLLTDLK